MIVVEEYGKALWKLASEEGKTEDYLETLSSMEEIFRRNPGYAKLLDTPAVATEEKLALIDRAFGGIEGNLLSFLKILCEKHAVYQLSGCVSAYRKRYREENGIAEAFCETAVPLSEPQKDALTRKLAQITGKKIVLTCKTDPSVIGGIVLRMEGRQLDGSIRARLDEFRRSLAGVIV